MVCIAIEVCLQRQGFNVTIADGGEAGMRELSSADFDVMLVDIFMPHMRGFESIRLFHERAPEIPLIAMSGYAFANADTASPDFLRMTLELGATRCLRKPFTPQALLAAVNDCLAKPSMSAQPFKEMTMPAGRAKCAADDPRRLAKLPVELRCSLRDSPMPEKLVCSRANRVTLPKRQLADRNYWKCRTGNRSRLPCLQFYFQPSSPPPPA